MQIRDLPLSSDRRRARHDRLIRYGVTGCGMLVLVTLMLIFVWLLYSIWPLFRPVSMSEPVTLRVNTDPPALALGMLPDHHWGYRLDARGQGAFIPLSAARPAASPVTPLTTPLAPPVTALAHTGGVLPIYGLGHADGRLTLVQPVMPVTGQPPHWAFPQGQGPQVIDGNGRPLVRLSLVAGEGAPLRVAAVTADRRLRVRELPSGLDLTLPLAAMPDSLNLTPNGRLLFVQTGPLLQVYTLRNGALGLRQSVALADRGPVSVTLLSGGGSLLVNAGGRLSQWFDVNGPQGPRLTRIRDFAPQNVTQLAAEPMRRVFATLDTRNTLTLNAAVQTGPLLSRPLPNVRSMAFSPQGDALLAETATGWLTLCITNPYPDISLRSLWQKVWYEGYPEPAYVWQSTSAAEGYQPKFSLMPVIAGTLKAALCAMLFAVPLALSGAAYTAWFMTPRLRRLVKPALEVMGALPTVVIGLIAGIWLAPMLQHILFGVLLLPWLLALVTLAASLLAARLRWRTAGREVFFLLPLLAGSVWLVCRFSPWLEQALFGMPLAQWFGEGYQPRNTLVVGVAMGFALVPVIFTLAEDALFSVPPLLSQGSLALGATPWQTLRRVIMPAAGAGIFSALMIGFGRAVGETMIVLMATGNTPIMDGSLLQGLRALAANIAIELPEAVADSGHYRVLMLTALVLFLF
ncbi:MAG: ABC transporter permease subunit, partial [Yersiniaceae bacterium]|nr:ABC transporter permease subunit [Yersiniaceae bacterium]